MFASLTFSEDTVESHSMLSTRIPASAETCLCFLGGIIRGGEETWGVREEAVTRPRCSGARLRRLMGRVGDLRGLERLPRS